MMENIERLFKFELFSQTKIRHKSLTDTEIRLEKWLEIVGITSASTKMFLFIPFTLIRCFHQTGSLLLCSSFDIG